MSQQLSPLKVRISYAEHKHVRQTLEKIAEKEGVTLTDLLQSATQKLIDEYEEVRKSKRVPSKRTRRTT